LGNLGDARAVGPLIETFQNTDYKNYAALESLVKLGEPALLPLFEALKDPNNNVRRNAVEALKKFGDARAIAPLTSLLYDRDPNIGYVARDAIESIRNRNLL
jgi:HEAT repeat protein